MCLRRRESMNEANNKIKQVKETSQLKKRSNRGEEFRNSKNSFDFPVNFPVKLQDSFWMNLSFELNGKITG